MATLSDAQIAAYAKQAGWTGKDIPIAIAIALAESSGNPAVVNYLGCTGLWQVYVKVHQPRHPLWTTEWLKQPANNAQAAYTIWREAGNSWRPWTTYTSGSYRRFSKRANDAAQVTGSADATAGLLDNPLITNPIGRALVPGVDDVLDATTALSEFVGKIKDPHNQRRILFVLVGIVLVLVGLINLSAVPDKLISTAKVATDVLPQTRVAKVAGKVGKVAKTAKKVAA